MPEIDVDPAALLAVTGPLHDVADRLAAVSAALGHVGGDVGSAHLLHALEDAAHVWRPALLDLAGAVDGVGGRLSSASAAYDGVEALVSDWAGG